jgi:hypothetical protein
VGIGDRLSQSWEHGWFGKVGGVVIIALLVAAWLYMANDLGDGGGEDGTRMEQCVRYKGQRGLGMEAAIAACE